MPAHTAERRARSALARLARGEMDNDTFRYEAAAILQRAIGFDWWCWVLVDPAVCLPTRAIHVNAIPGQDPRRYFRLIGEAWNGQVAAGTRRGQHPVRVVSATTGDDLRRGRLWEEMLRPCGTGDALTAPLVADETCWAQLHLGRDSSGHRFTGDEAALIAAVAPLLATRLRDGLRAVSQPSDPCPEPGTIVVDRELSVVAATGQAWRWLDRLGPRQPADAGPLPGFLYAIATRVAGTDPPRTIRVRLQAADGHWLVVQVAPLTSGPGTAAISGGYAITLESARSDDLAPLLMRAWALSPREREVARLAIDGLSTEDIAIALFISPHTVRDHLKAIFDKVGIHRRSEMVAALAGTSVP